MPGRSDFGDEMPPDLSESLRALMIPHPSSSPLTLPDQESAYDREWCRDHYDGEH
jgi:hypothetical protein